MDSYTDVSGQCCGCGCRHVSCNTSSQNDSGSYWQPDYPDMNTVPWAVSDNNTVPSYSYMDQTYPNVAASAAKTAAAKTTTITSTTTSTSKSKATHISHSPFLLVCTISYGTRRQSVTVFLS